MGNGPTAAGAARIADPAPPPDLAECLRVTEGIDPNDPAVRELARDVVGTAVSRTERAHRLFDFVRDNWRYNYRVRVNELAGIWSPAAIRRTDGFCVEKAVTLATLSRAAGVPAAVTFQTIRDCTLPRERIDEFMPAGLMRGLALHLEGRWVRLDPTQDARTAERLNCELVMFSKNEDRFLPERTKDGRPLVEIVEPDLGIYAGVPAWIVDATVNGEWQRGTTTGARCSTR